MAEFVGFCLVWLALIVLSADGLRHQPSSRYSKAVHEAVSA